ncbi:zinc-ribbon domain-containing protein [Roseinatronobacter sp.]|uniref:zinc-ribbon domain-containing protein n=1 Tax=Roseinatronobacter sp. TaxID=1945755 RepID=UPI0025E7E1B9|nr:zinc-ribbon domain-containing protein [Rhodobaca sp.]
MRIVCTECTAQYEIDASLLPDAGREVQCSSCGHVWFQEKSPALAMKESAQEQPPLPSTQAQPKQLPEPEPTPEPKTAIELETEAEAEAEAQQSPAQEVGASPMPPPPPRNVDEKVLEILREEAEFESRQRAQEAGTLETQPDLGLSGPEPWPSEPKTKTPTAAEDTTTEAPKSAQATFPDIEDISASLEPIGNNRARRKSGELDLPATTDMRRRSFRTGLALPILLAVILILPYLLAQDIISALPASEPVLTEYVATVDGIRMRIAALLNS